LNTFGGGRMWTLLCDKVRRQSARGSIKVFYFLTATTTATTTTTTTTSRPEAKAEAARVD
jgi:hypothetical protein